MVFASGLSGTGSLLRGEASGLRPWPDLGLPGGRVRGLGLSCTASPLPSPTSTSSSSSHLDIAAQRQMGVGLNASIIKYRLCKHAYLLVYHMIVNTRS